MKRFFGIWSRLRSALLCLPMIVGWQVPAVARNAHARPTSELLVDASDGRVIYSEQPDALHRPASLAKMMALYLVFDALEAGRIRMSDTLTFSHNAARQQPSRLGIAADKTLSVREAIHAIAVDSANDVTVAMAEKLGVSESKFADLMTTKAQQLGMRRTMHEAAARHWCWW
ncbi:D-alanyl-D-alanine carboxypeptidase family protein [Sphingomonas sp. UYP23]